MDQCMAWAIDGDRESFFKGIHPDLPEYDQHLKQMEDQEPSDRLSPVPELMDLDIDIRPEGSCGSFRHSPFDLGDLVSTPVGTEDIADEDADEAEGEGEALPKLDWGGIGDVLCPVAVPSPPPSPPSPIPPTPPAAQLPAADLLLTTPWLEEEEEEEPNMGLKFLTLQEEHLPFEAPLPIEEPAEHLLPNLKEPDAVPVVAHQLPEEPAAQLLPILVQSEPLALEDYLPLEVANGRLLLEAPPLESPLELGPPAVTVLGPPSDPVNSMGSPTLGYINMTTTPSPADRTELLSDKNEYITLTPPQSLEFPPAPSVRMRYDCWPQKPAVFKQLPTVQTLERVPPPVMLRMQTAQVSAQPTAQPLPSPSDDADSGLGSPMSTIHSDESCDSDSSSWVKNMQTPSLVSAAATEISPTTRPKRPASRAAAQRPPPRARPNKVATRSKARPARPPAPPAAGQPSEPNDSEVKKYSGPRTGVCTVCGKHNKRLDKHMMVHNKWKPHKCNLCTYEATQSEHLARHKQRHKETKDPSRTLKCPVCAKSLSRKDKLRDHMRQHE